MPNVNIKPKKKTGLKFLAVDQGQKFVAVLKAKNRGAATSQNVKNRGIVAAKIVKIAAMSRQNRENRGFVAANILIIAA